MEGAARGERAAERAAWEPSRKLGRRLARLVVALGALGGPRGAVTQDAGVFVPGLGLVASRLVPRHQLLGPQVLNRVNASAAVVSSADAAEACDAMRRDGPGGIAHEAHAVLQRYAGRVVLLLGAEFATLDKCAMYLPGTYILAELLCRYVSQQVVIVLPQRGRSPGAFSSYMSSGFAQLSECAVFESVATDLTVALAAAATGSSWNVDLHSEPDEFTEMFSGRWAAFFKYVPCAVCLGIAVQAIATVWERKRRTTGPSHPCFFLVLFWNFWIMVALAALSYYDGWGVTTEPATFQVRNSYMSMFSGQGSALNLLLAQLWRSVLNQDRTSHATPLRGLFGPFLFVALFDAASTACIIFRLGGFFLRSTVMPGSLALLEICVSLRLLYLSRVLLKTIRASAWHLSDQQLVQRMSMLEINIARSATVSAISSLLTVACLVAGALGLTRRSPSALVVIGITGYVARCSTAAAQIRFCWPAGSSHHAVAPDDKPVSAAAGKTLASAFQSPRSSVT